MNHDLTISYWNTVEKKDPENLISASYVYEEAKEKFSEESRSRNSFWVFLLYLLDEV